jgi:hypothetical protein
MNQGRETKEFAAADLIQLVWTLDSYKITVRDSPLNVLDDIPKELLH